jgi:hypothetical protein
MASPVPDLIPMYVEGVMTQAQIDNINTALILIYQNLPTRPVIIQTVLDNMSKMGDRREKDAKAIAKVLKVSPNILLPPLTPAALSNTLELNDQLYLLQLDFEELSQYAKTLVDITGAQGTNWAIFAKYTVDLLAKLQNPDAKIVMEKLIKALKDVEQEVTAGKLSKSDKAILKEAKDALKVKKGEGN